MRCTPAAAMLLLAFQVAVSQNFDWAKHFGAAQSDQGLHVAVDADGNVYVTGSFMGTVDFDPGADTFNLTAAAFEDAFISKFNMNGDFLWAKGWGGSSGDFSNTIIVDAAGNLFVTGTFVGTVDFDPGADTSNLTSAGPSDIDVYVSKFDSSGNFLWARKIGGTSNDFSTSLAIGPSGNLFVGGYFTGTTDFDPGPATFNLTSAGSDDLFVAKLDSLGNFVWAVRAGAANFDQVKSLCVDSSGNVYAIGRFQATVDFDPGPGTYNLTSSGVRDVVALKLGLSGELIWARRIGGISADGFGDALTLDGMGNLYATGRFQGTVDFDPGPGTYNLTSAGSYDVFVLRLDINGNFIWARRFGGISSDSGQFLASDTNGYITVTGYFMGTADFDPGYGVLSKTSVGAEDIFLTRYDPTGNVLWAHTWGGTSGDIGGTVQLDSDGNTLLTGYFYNTVDFDPGPGTLNLTSAGTMDVFVMRLNKDSCADFTVVIDSVSSVTCSDSGYVMAHGKQGRPPYSFLWNSTPPEADSVLRPATGGLYRLDVTDNASCTRSTEVPVSGPVLAGFDLNVNLAAASFRPGFPSHVRLDAFNRGCVPVRCDLKLTFDTLLSYAGAVPPADSVAGTALFWHFDSLTFNASHIMPDVLFTVSNSASIGDSVCLSADVVPLAGDADTANNSKRYCFPVINGYDPNDKQVYPQGICAENYVLMAPPMTYVIRFQNTGNADAINVHILDSLDPVFDLSTIRIIGSSHAQIAEVTDGLMKIRFDSIMLPDSTADEPGSHGYVIYEISLKAGLPYGTQISNKSAIYFDYNIPVVTNTVTNTLTDVLAPCIPTAAPKAPAHLRVRIFPNPSAGWLRIELAGIMEDRARVSVTSLLGQILFSEEFLVTDMVSHHEVHLPALPGGAYFITVSTRNTQSSEKLFLAD